MKKSNKEGRNCDFGSPKIQMGKVNMRILLMLKRGFFFIDCKYLDIFSILTIFHIKLVEMKITHKFLKWVFLKV